MIIDIHTHIYPDKIANATVDKLAAGPGLRPATDGTAYGLKQSMKDTNTDISFIMPVATNPVKVNKLNEFAFGFCGQDGLYSFGAMHPDCEYWKDELIRIKDHGLKGIKVHPVYQKTDFDDVRFLRIFEKSAELGLFVLTHSGLDIGFPKARNCSVDKLYNAVKQVGKFKVIFAHMGGWEQWNEAVAMLAETGAYIDTAFSLGTYTYNDSKARNAEIKTEFGDVGNFVDKDLFMKYVKAFGTDRILFGSDSPWDTQKTGIDFINSMPLNEEEKMLILGGNAKGLFLNPVD